MSSRAPDAVSGGPLEQDRDERVGTGGAAPPRGSRRSRHSRSSLSMIRLFDLSPDLLGAASPDGYFTLLNAAWQRVLGWTLDELMARPFLAFVHPDDVEETTAEISKLAAHGGVAHYGFENRYRTRTGDYRRIEWTIVPDIDTAYFVAKDVSDKRAAEAQRDRAAQMMRTVIESVADGLWVTDARGRLILMNHAGIRLLGYDSPDEVLGRNPHTVFHHRHEDGTPYPIDQCPLADVGPTGRRVHVGEDTFWRRDGVPVPVSYSSAPIATAEGAGSVVAFHDITLVQTERARLRAQVAEAEWFDEIRQAMIENRLELFEQPIVDLSSGRTYKHELLLRLRSRQGAVVEPRLFLPAAEKYGLIEEIDRWVITQAITLAASGRRVAFNVSAESIGKAGILMHIEDELARTGAEPGLLTLEVTETAVMDDLEEGKRFADRLVSLGCSFALDDFGTGYGSLTYLRQLPITYVKIDAQFVQGLTTDPSDRALVEAIVHIAQSLGKRTIAEGVEDEPTLRLLRDLGVELAQGYHLGRPAPSS